MDLERVADRAPERLVHVGQEADDLAARPRADLAHLPRELARVVDRLHERAVADLDVEHDRVGPAASFFDMIELAISGMMSTVAVTSRSA